MGKNEFYTKLPKEGFNNCILCKAKTNGTAFCKECWDKYSKQEMLDILNEYTRKKTEEELKIITGEEKQAKELTCLICGEPSNGKPQCKKCYNDVKNFMDTLDKNYTIHEFREHYYNLKDRIFIMKRIEETKKYCNKLIAIAMMNQNVNDDSSLMDRVYIDVENLIKSKKPIEIKNEEIKQKQIEKDEKNARIETAQDGHNVKSGIEVIIDDILYNAYILHCYGKQIEEIEEKRRNCDWFIPVKNGKGIYIEYWGMEEPDYLKKRKEKEELYNKYNVPYIGIEKDDPKKDTQTFKSNLLREIKKLAKDYYGFMPEWK